MKRRLFNILSVISLYLCVTVGVVWNATYRLPKSVPIGGGYVLILYKGRFLFMPPPSIINGVDTFTFTAKPHAIYLLDKTLSSFWLMTLLTGILPVIWLVRVFFVRDPLLNCCRVCGYDLRATPERCPECGTVRAKAEGGREWGPPIISCSPAHLINCSCEVRAEKCLKVSQSVAWSARRNMNLACRWRDWLDKPRYRLKKSSDAAIANQVHSAAPKANIPSINGIVGINEGRRSIARIP
jgi:hypothetical protein